MMKPEQAERIGISALAWLASDRALLEVFLANSGAAVDDVLEMGAAPEFLGAVLDFLLLADSHITAFCESEHLPYDAPMQARQLLPGGAAVNWT